LGSDGGHGKPKLIGSAAVLKYHNQYYVVTAGHVLSEVNINDIRIGEINENLLDYQISYFQNDDVVDIGVIKITEAISKRIIQGPKKIIDLDNKSNYLSRFRLTKGWVATAGYPASRAKTWAGPNIMKLQSKTIKGTIREEIKDSTDTTFSFHYNRKKSRKEGIKQVVMGPKPAGMSGSPVWLDESQYPELMEFAGVVIEYCPRNKYIVATRAEVVLQCIQEIERHLQATQKG
jgi:uncharacterized protein YlzI (FlbEa/FlbD family)